MASACVTMTPRISFTHDEELSRNQLHENVGQQNHEKSDLAGFSDFEFRLEDPVTMLPADELFSDGKLVPLQLNNIQQPIISSSDNIHLRTHISTTDPYLFSPKAPTCSIHWKQLLRLKKLYQKSNVKEEEMNKMVSLSENGSKNAVRSLKNFLPRSSKCSLNDSSINVPFLKENDVISSSRLSLSSSSSGHEVDEIPRLSLDSEKASVVTNKCSKIQVSNTSVSRVKVAKLKQIRRVPEISEHVQSPRMNPSGKIVFQSLERSSSSPSTFNGAPRYKHGRVERSYSEKVRIKPVLNVPVGSFSRSGVFGIPLFSSSQQKKVVQQSYSKKSVERA